MKKFITAALFLFFASVSFAGGYKRVISLAPSVTESLYEIGMDEEVIAITVYCPKGKTKKEIIGTLLEPDFEKIIFLKPDLIISTKEGNSKAAVEKLARLGLNVYVMETSMSFEEICRNYLELAKKVGKGNEAAKIVDEAKESVRAVYGAITQNGTQSVFWEVGAKPLYTAGGQSFVNDYNFYTKTENIYKNLNARYIQIDVEDVITKNPDIIILANMGDIAPSEIDFWKKYKTLKAAANGKIFMIDAAVFFTPTPKTFADGAQFLAETIYADR
ncbi:MAG: helical backbone metal receptor [Endomicrobium sp.]|jgi:iron complex transport system substrate-binding protein|nr:helical backbone metal receptor [Endomicrobium sp.]